jgi:hypothetical protein
MNASSGQRQAADLGAFEFELTDIAEARKALDELPPGVESVLTMSPGYWLSRRRKPESGDLALTRPAIDWMMGLLPHLRPQAGAQRFPRLVNAIAKSWETPGECDSLLEGLLNDCRPGRQGLPSAVRSEFEALRTARASAAGTRSQ